MKAIRNMVQSAATRMAGDTEESKRTEEVVARSARVQRALDAYCAKLLEMNAASRALFAELDGFYPAGGPLANPLHALAAAEAASPWSEASGTTRTEAMQMVLATPSAGIGRIAHGITEGVKARDTLAQEVAHYTEKVGRLQTEAAAVRPADRDAAKAKLDDNKEKLARAMDAHKEKLHAVSFALDALDGDIAAVLTPTVIQLIKAQMSWLTDSVNFYNKALEQVDTAATLVPRRASAVHTGASASAAAAATAAATTAPAAAAAAAAAAATAPATAATASPSAVAAGASPAGALRPQPLIVRGLAQYTAGADGDVSFEAGDVFLVTRKNGDGWWDARNGDQFGVCPNNFVKEVCCYMLLVAHGVLTANTFHTCSPHPTPTHRRARRRR